MQTIKFKKRNSKNNRTKRVGGLFSRSKSDMEEKRMKEMEMTDIENMLPDLDRLVEEKVTAANEAAAAEAAARAGEKKEKDRQGMLKDLMSELSWDKEMLKQQQDKDKLKQQKSKMAKEAGQKALSYGTNQGAILTKGGSRKKRKSSKQRKSKKQKKRKSRKHKSRRRQRKII